MSFQMCLKRDDELRVFRSSRLLGKGLQRVKEIAANTCLNREGFFPSARPTAAIFFLLAHEKHFKASSNPCNPKLINCRVRGRQK